MASEKGRYEIIRQITAGKNSQVYLVNDRRLSVRKIMKEMTCDQPDDFDRRRQRFISEINVLKELRHPQIPNITDAFATEDSLVIVMDLVKGENLQDHITKRGRVDEESVIQYGLQIASIFIYLHGRNPPIIHRDLKPSNLMIDESGTIHLIDFGIASRGEEREEISLGTLGYAAPEQYDREDRVDERTDIYGMGRTLIFCMTGNPACRELGEFSAFMVHFLQKATERDLKLRYQTMEEVERELRIYDRRQRGRKKASFYLYVISILGFLLLGFVGIQREYRESRARIHVSYAEEAGSEVQRQKQYECALRIAPWECDIYESMSRRYISQGEFSLKIASQLINILEETNSLDYLRKRRPASYAQFCYELAIGYFYYVGGERGRIEAEIWFQRALSTQSNGFGQEQETRAEIYRKICDYYASFLRCGEDQSGEGSNYSYRDFFETIRELNQCALSKLKEQGAEESDRNCAYMALREVVMEIRKYASYFLLEADTSCNLLLEELDKVEYAYKDVSAGVCKKIDRLMELTADTKKRIQILEENNEKN